MWIIVMRNPCSLLKNLNTEFNLSFHQLEIAIPGSRVPEISRDFGINKIYLFNGLFSTFKNNIVHLLIL